MTYENEYGTPGRLAADDEYGTLSQEYAAQQYGSEAPGGRDDRGESEPDWRDMPGQPLDAPGANGSDAGYDEDWPAAGAAPEELGEWPSAGAPPRGVPVDPRDLPIEYGAPRVGRARPGGLHAPLAAGESAYVDWIKGLGTSDAGQDQWASTEAAGRDSDDDDESPDDWELGPAARDEPAEDGSPDGWSTTGVPLGYPPQRDAPAEDWASASRSEPVQPQPAEEENWFEPKQSPADADPGYPEPAPPARHEPPPGQWARALPSAEHRPAPVQEEWIETRQQDDGQDWPSETTAPVSAAPVSAAPVSAAPVSAPPRYAWGSDWPRSAAELDYVTPDRASVPTTAYPGAIDYVGPDDGPGTYGSRDDETAMLMLDGHAAAPQRRRKPQSYRLYAIGAAVFVVVIIGGVAVALHGGPDQPVGSTTSDSSGAPAAPLPGDTSPSDSASPSDPASASSSPSAATSLPASPTAARAPARPTPTPRHSTTPPPRNPPPPPTRTTPAATPTTPAATPTTPASTLTPTPTDTSTPPA
jgi:hypothetical protein